MYVSAARQQESFTKIISYSPLSSGLNIGPGESSYTDLILPESPPLSEVTIVTKSALVHFHRDFEFEDIHLVDFAPLHVGFDK